MSEAIQRFLRDSVREVEQKRRSEFVATINSNQDIKRQREEVYKDPIAFMNRAVDYVMGVDVGKDGRSVVAIGENRGGVVHMSEIAQYPSENIFSSGRAVASNALSVSNGPMDFFVPSPTFSSWSAGLANGEASINTRNGVQAQSPVCTLTADEETAQRPSMSLPRVSLTAIQTETDELTADLAHKAEKMFGYAVLRQSKKLENPLRRILRELDIEPFDSAAVKGYKEKAAVYRTAELKRQIMARLDFKSLSQYQVNSATRAIWDRTELGDYDGEVPLHALNLACQIKQELPGVDMHIDELFDDPFLVAEYDGEEYYLAVWAEPKFEASLG